MEFHEVSNIFPLMEGKEFELLKEDIKKNGLHEPIWIYQNKIIDGRNRYRACSKLSIEPKFSEYVGDNPLAFVISMNLHRRHLSESQRAVIAAKLANIELGDNQFTIGSANLPILNQSTAAEMMNVSPRIIRDVKAIEREAPELIPEIEKGEITVHEASKKVKKQKKKKAQNISTYAVETIMLNKPKSSLVVVSDGDWWKLGDHLLYVGDTSQPIFIDKLPQSSFAFADPPYGTNKAGWDKEFYWEHDYLIDKAKVVAVTPGIVSIFKFAKITTMPYVWSIACWINNGMTRGAIGFGNWIYTALFSNDSIFCQEQDFIQVSIDNNESKKTKHESRKPAALLVKLISMYSKEGDYIIDPFLGSGTTLFAADELKRLCVGGEINHDYCKEIIGRWNKTHDDKAKKI